MRLNCLVCICAAILCAACAQLPPAPPPGPKHVVVNKALQVLQAYDGNQLVFQSHVSTGREGKNTPNGHFTAGQKLRMHYSRLYDNAPMPFSVQVTGNYFIHGYSSVPDYPASHGCIRLPVKDAEWFFNWVDVGTPIDIVGHWPGNQD